MKERAHKIIAQSGLMSRRKAEEAIAAGRVALNGVVFTSMGQLVDLATDELTVDGARVELRTEKKTFIFYKPREVVTTKIDEKNRSTVRKTVMDFFKDEPSLNPVGRLDFESEGLLLMTHDGDLLLKLTHPRYGVKKVYEVDIETSNKAASTSNLGSGGFLPVHTGEWSEKCREQLLSSVELEDGPGKFDELTELVRGKTFLVTVSEGRNRFIRRMFEALRFRVTRLKRLKMGEYELGDLKPGQRREVT